MSGASVREKLIAYLDRMSEEQLTELLATFETVLNFEKRRHARKAYDLQVVYAFNNTFHTDAVKNISISGMFIETDADLSAGDELYLSLTLPGNSDPLKLKGVVKHISKDGVGIEYKASAYHRDKVLSHIHNHSGDNPIDILMPMPLT